MFEPALTPADTARAKLGQAAAIFTRDECAVIIGKQGVNYGPLGRATPEQLTDHLYAIVRAGLPVKRLPEVSNEDVAAAYRARRAAEAGK